jgi:REP element-mobilizing transposase RayT
MPRQARLDNPGALHHIMIRGIEKTNIFRDAEDKDRFLERLEKNVQESQCVIYAWVLMDNHVLCGASHNTFTSLFRWVRFLFPVSFRTSPFAIPGT